MLRMGGGRRKKGRPVAYQWRSQGAMVPPPNFLQMFWSYRKKMLPLPPPPQNVVGSRRSRKRYRVTSAGCPHQTKILATPLWRIQSWSQKGFPKVVKWLVKVGANKGVKKSWPGGGGFRATKKTTLDTHLQTTSTLAR